MSTRSDIRDKYLALYAGLSGVSTVYRGRRRNVPESALPAVCVYVESEDKAPAGVGGSDEMVRTLKVVSEIHVSGNTIEAVEELLDTLCAAREALVFADETLGGLVLDTVPASDEYDLSDEAKKPAGTSACTDSVLYIA